MKYTLHQVKSKLARFLRASKAYMIDTEINEKNLGLRWIGVGVSRQDAVASYLQNNSEQQNQCGFV